MIIIRYTGWKYGLQKISLVELLQDYAHLSLGESKHMVDKILRNQVQEVYLKDISIALELLKRSQELGAVCELSTTDK